VRRNQGPIIPTFERLAQPTYTADSAYFANADAQRPKAPFSALVIAGRSAWTNTVPFYPVSYSRRARAVADGGREILSLPGFPLREHVPVPM
jgi:hypothetical protein